MTRPVNLLPWREKRRRECVRFWGWLFIGVWLVAFASAITLRMGRTPEQTGLRLKQESDRALMRAFTEREHKLAAGQQLWLQIQEQQSRREATRLWQTTLDSLARQMPEQAWLTALQWQGDTLSFSGLANRFPALAQLDAAARSLPDFDAVTPGATRRDEQGRWQFSYQLRREATHAQAR